MIYFYYIWLLIFGIIGYVCITDSNVLYYMILLFKMAGIQIQRFFWIIRLHPKNPIVNLVKKYEYQKIAKELEKELKEKL